VIGNQKDEPIRRFTTRISKDRFKPAEGEATVCGLYLETDPATGLARRIEPIRIGGRLSQTVPQVEAVSA
jgi:calcineurin-like phosphoesterase